MNACVEKWKRKCHWNRTIHSSIVDQHLWRRWKVNESWRKPPRYNGLCQNDMTFWCVCFWSEKQGWAKLVCYVATLARNSLTHTLRQLASVTSQSFIYFNLWNRVWLQALDVYFHLLSAWLFFYRQLTRSIERTPVLFISAWVR